VALNEEQRIVGFVEAGFLPPPAGIEDGAKVVQSADASYLDGMVDAAIVAAAKALVESGATVEALDRGEDDGGMMRSTRLNTILAMRYWPTLKVNRALV